MSSYQMKMIIIMMSIACIGLVGFQYYWVTNAFRINEERFEQLVYQSMQATVSQIESNETSDIFLSYLAQDTMLQQSLFERIEPIVVQVRQRPIPRRRPSVVDSLLLQPVPQVSQRFRRLIESRGIDPSILTDLDNFFTNLTPQIASSIFTMDEMEILLQERERQIQYLNQAEAAFRSRYGVVIEPDFVEEYNIPRDAIEKIRNANLKIELMNRVWQELLEGQKDVFSRMDTGMVKTLLESNFKDRGITEVFDLGILDDKGQLITYPGSRQSEQLLKNGIQARLFPGDILGKENYLLVNFPNKNAYVIRQIWLPMLSSLFFIGIVIFSFVYAIRVIIKQKNLSQIKNDFINNMTHEFKTPIATVSLAVEALQDPSLMSQDNFRNRYLNIIKDENKRLGTQVEKVLQSATLDKKEFKLKLEKVHLPELLQYAVGHISLQVENRGGKIEFEDQLKEPLIDADEFHLTHLVNNLLDNALKYSNDEPQISLKTWDQNGSVYISVADNGIGMSKETQKKIFDKFYRVPTGNLHDVKGFGLGLSYVKTMTEAHKGNISVSSEPGKGSIFTLKLPKTQ